MPYFEKQSTWGRTKLPLQKIDDPNQVQRDKNHHYRTEQDALRHALAQEHNKFPDSHHNRDECPVCHPELDNPGPGRDIDVDLETDDEISIEELLNPDDE